MLFKGLWCLCDRSLDEEVKVAAIIKLSPENTEMSHCTQALMSFFYETISIYKTKYQETKAFGVNEIVDSETLQGCAPSRGNLTKVKSMLMHNDDR